MHLSIMFKLFIITMILGHLCAAFADKYLANNVTTVEGFGPRGPLEGGKGSTPVEKQLSRTNQGVTYPGPDELHVSLHGGVGQNPQIPPYLRNRNIPNIRQVPSNKIGFPRNYGQGAYPIGYSGVYNFGYLPSRNTLSVPNVNGLQL